MDARFWKAAIAGFVTLFAIGFVLYGWLLADFFAANTAEGLIQDPPNFPFILAGQLVYAVFLTLVLGWKGVSNPGDGFKAAASVGVLVSLAINLTQLGAFNMNTGTSMAADLIIQLVQVGIAGAVIGKLLGGSSGAEPAMA